MLAVCLLLLLGAPASAASAPAAAEAPSVDQAKLRELYDEALDLYAKGEYKKALQTWSEIIRLDPEQTSARTRILDAREALKAANRRKIEELEGDLHAGRYEKALLDLQPLIEEDPSAPRWRLLHSRLELLAAIVPEASTDTKAWRIAVLGLSRELAPRADAKACYDALRYALELDPEQRGLGRLLEWFLSVHPEQAGADPVTPGMRLIEYKHSLALNDIYEGRYHRAVGVLGEILALEPGDLLALKRLGSSYFALNRYPEARQAWKRALELSPDDAQLKKFLKQTAATQKE